MGPAVLTVLLERLRLLVLPLAQTSSVPEPEPVHWQAALDLPEPERQREG
jgi:hypothetical protein